MAERYFAPCPRGLEAALADELTQLGAAKVATTDGGVAFAGDLALAMHANLESRLASRILWRVGGGPYRNEKDVYALVHAIDWHRLFTPERTLRVDVAATRSPLTSLEFVTLRTKDAVCDRFRAERGIRPSVDKRAPDVRIYIYLTDRDAIVYVDTSGEPLFKRGYRRDADEAPLRENLAAGLLALARWTPEQTLLDPMCGSATIVIEAAMIAAQRAPGLKRSFGFQKLMWYDGPSWQRIKQSAHDRVREPSATPTIFGSDIDASAIAKAISNISAAQMNGFAAIERADVLTRSAPVSSGIVLANPPYGVRLSDQQQLAAFYPLLGDALKKRFAGWTAYLFSGDMRLPKLLGLKVAKRTPLYNGALDCRLFEIPLVAGSMRDGAMLKSKAR
ncbi:MAG: class I SAM-dependent RNA methyltransferase [Betaproteobacteria bacterium]|nr:MAG: class I SAM-dependent RNA methyltransferase [Betaproteobacteria bacterium]